MTTETVIDSTNPFQAPTNADISAEDLRNWGFVSWRVMPDGDIWGVLPMTFGKGRLCSGVNPFGSEDAWCYPSELAATLAMFAFSPETESEPTGWHRHVQSGRRRENCDPTKETVYF